MGEASRTVRLRLPSRSLIQQTETTPYPWGDALSGLRSPPPKMHGSSTKKLTRWCRADSPRNRKRSVVPWRGSEGYAEVHIPTRKYLELDGIGPSPLPGGRGPRGVGREAETHGTALG